MGNSLATTYPAPRSPTDGIPVWAIAVIAVAAAIIIIWLIAIIGLIVYEVLREIERRRESEKPEPSNNVPMQTFVPSPVPQAEPEPNFETLSTKSFTLRDDQPEKGGLDDPEVIENDYSDMVVSTGSVDVRKPLSEERLYMSGDDLRSEDEGGTEEDLEGMILSRPVNSKQLGATLREPSYLENEFKKVPNSKVTPKNIPPEAQLKNRYSNVLPNPRTRVPLKYILPVENSDYINANYVRGYQGTAKQYIATQGPIEETVDDFWRMVWENNSDIIVMMCDFVEGGTEKCTRYWPAQGSKLYGKLEVTVIEQETKRDMIATNLRLTHTETNESHDVRHVRYTAWTTSGVPKETDGIVDFLKELKMADSGGPVVVHCSAGIGRTGVLIAVDIGLQAILQGDKTVDVLRITSTLRQDRAGAVQTKDQYKFIHQALYDVAREEGL